MLQTGTHLDCIDRPCVRMKLMNIFSSHWLFLTVLPLETFVVACYMLNIFLENIFNDVVV